MVTGMIRKFSRDGLAAEPHSVLFSDLKPGSPFKYTDASGKYSMVKGTILEIDPPRRLVHTYQFSHLQDPPSRVTWELEQAGEEVIVRLTHDKFEKPTKTYQMVKGGWKEILDNLKLWIETGDIAFSTKFKYAMFRPLIPLLCKKD